MESQSPVEQITSLFDISSLVTFLVTAGGVILLFALGKKALSMARAFLIDKGHLDHPDDPYYGSDIPLEDRVYHRYNYDRSTNTYYKPKKKKRYYKRNYRKNNYRRYRKY